MSKRKKYFKHPLTGEWVSQERLHQDCLKTMIENHSGLLSESEIKSAKQTLEERYGYRNHPSAT